jgi:predicted amidohydrolase YtcJ
MSTQALAPRQLSPLTVFLARKIHTMDESLPIATAVAVADGRIVAVGDLESIRPWCEGRKVIMDERFANKVLLPGLIDNHIHPFLGSILMPTEHIAPEPWRQADGSIRPAARTPEDYRRLLLERIAAHPDKSELFVTFGYQASLHGTYTRAVLDELFPDRPVLIIQRSFHEHVFNTAGLNKLGITQDMLGTHPQMDWATGRFWETGLELVITKLMPLCLAPNWYHKGLGMMTQLMQQGGITTAADMLFGAIDPDFELAALDLVLEKGGAPMRVVNICDARAIANRAQGKKVMDKPDAPVDFAAVIPPWKLC